MKNNIFQAGRAKHAYATATEGVSVDATATKEFVSSAQKLGMLVKINGLVPALLFAQTKKQFGSLSSRVMLWLADSGSPVSKLLDGRTEIGYLTEVDSTSYRLLTSEAQRYLAWVKRFAVALAPQND
jgi:CRISPR type III-B/RAMP module-associated protein Cmr5